ncbi:MAG: hypothetical protein LBV12_10030 [Puniceicoccales bacterium]|jgi:excisionase family DNA binding protein|nr:hypothetical protein [Puniceicoccales bacterium]
MTASTKSRIDEACADDAPDGPGNDKHPRFLRPEQYAEHIGISKRHLLRFVSSGLIPSIRLGHRCVLIPVAEADATLLKLSTGGKATQL